MSVKYRCDCVEFADDGPHSDRSFLIVDPDPDGGVITIHCENREHIDSVAIELPKARLQELALALLEISFQPNDKAQLRSEAE